MPLLCQLLDLNDAEVDCAVAHFDVSVEVFLGITVGSEGLHGGTLPASFLTVEKFDGVGFHSCLDLFDIPNILQKEREVHSFVPLP